MKKVNKKVKKKTRLDLTIKEITINFGYIKTNVK